MLDDSLSAYSQDTLVSTDTVCVHQKQVHARLAYLQSRIQSARLTPTRLAPIFAFTPRTHSGSHALRICTLLLATVLPPSGTLPISLTKSAVLTTREENQEAKQDWTSLHKDRVEYALYFVMQ